MRSIFRVVVASALLLVAPRVARADIIGVGWGDGSVVRIDPATGVGVALGASGFDFLNTLARDSAGTLVASTVDGSQLVTIDETTGAGAHLAPLTPFTLDLRALAFSPADVLYGTHRPCNALPCPLPDDDLLYTIDVGTGVAALVGPTGEHGIQAMDFAPASGILYGWNNIHGLLTIDPLTGVATDVSLNATGPVEIQSIAFGPDGVLYGARDELYTIDLVTGVPMLVGSGGYSNLRGIEFVAAVPEPSSLLLITLATVACARRRLQPK